MWQIYSLLLFSHHSIRFSTGDFVCYTLNLYFSANFSCVNDSKDIFNSFLVVQVIKSIFLISVIILQLMAVGYYTYLCVFVVIVMNGRMSVCECVCDRLNQFAHEHSLFILSTWSLWANVAPIIIIEIPKSVFDIYLFEWRIFIQS